MHNCFFSCSDLSVNRLIGKVPTSWLTTTDQAALKYL
jgi:hypothetical protein